MKKETSERGFIRITPDENNYLYDGETLSAGVFCPAGNEDAWQEIGVAEAAAIVAEKEAAMAKEEAALAEAREQERGEESDAKND